MKPSIQSSRSECRKSTNKRLTRSWGTRSAESSAASGVSNERNKKSKMLWKLKKVNYVIGISKQNIEMCPSALTILKENTQRARGVARTTWILFWFLVSAKWCQIRVLLILSPFIYILASSPTMSHALSQTNLRSESFIKVQMKFLKQWKTE